MNRPTPSLAILAGVAVILALVFFGRQYLWPEHRADAMGKAAVAGYSRPPAAEAPDQDDEATVGGMMDAGAHVGESASPAQRGRVSSLPATVS